MAVMNPGDVSVRSRRAAAISQLSMFGLQVLLPAVLLVTAGRRDRFVRKWCLEALNLQVVWIGSFLLLLAITTWSHSGAFGWATAAVFEVVGIYSLICGVIGAVKSLHGESWQYPLNVRIAR